MSRWDIPPCKDEALPEASKEVMEILGSFTPAMRIISVDEACLDMSGTERLFSPPVTAALKIKEEVRKTGLTLSIGIAPNRYSAKPAQRRTNPTALARSRAGNRVY